VRVVEFMKMPVEAIRVLIKAVRVPIVIARAPKEAARVHIQHYHGLNKTLTAVRKYL
jgi:hypothetical protein